MIYSDLDNITKNQDKATHHESSMGKLENIFGYTSTQIKWSHM